MRVCIVFGCICVITIIVFAGQTDGTLDRKNTKNKAAWARGTKIPKDRKEKLGSTIYRTSAANDDGQAPDISPDPHVFESDMLPGNMRYMATVGNGHLATTIFGDTVYMNGLYNGYLGESHRARVPSMHTSNISVVGYTTNSTKYRLDTTRGIFEMRLSAYSGNDGVEVTYRVYAHHFYNRLLVTEFNLQRIGTSSLAINVSRESLNSDEDSVDLVLNATKQYIDSNIGCDTLAPDTCRERSGRIKTTETTSSGYTPVHYFWNDIPDNFVLESGEVNKTWTYLLSVDNVHGVAEDNFVEGMRRINNGDSAGVLQRHTNGWADVWSKGSITLEGDASILTLQKVIRGSMYYLYSSLPSLDTYKPNNQFFGLSPGGLANGEMTRDYYGHVFWDMETWMYPAMLLFSPELAKEMLSYRINGALPAFERALSGGYQGTRFPWESAFTGTEVTPDVCVPCRENQQHITGDIAFAARQYVSATRDIDWLTFVQAGDNYTGFDFIKSMAEFWYSRPSYSPTKDRYEINGVMPPDEHQQSINNSVYTNVVASLAIHFGRYAACLAGLDGAEEIPDSWINVAERLYFPYNNAYRYHEEYEGYHQDVVNNKTNPEYVKQADVVLLGFPLMWDMPDDVRENDLRHYETVTSPGGPAMTWGMFAVGWLDIDDDTKAASLFDRAYQLYYREPFKLWTEAQQGAGAINFITGMGGFLQSLISGYGGLRLHVEELKFRRPKMPVNVTKMTFGNINYLGSELDFVMDVSEVSVTAIATGSLPLKLYTNDGASWDLTEGVVRTFPVQAFTINTTSPSSCELPRDTIDVVYDQTTTTTTTTVPPDTGAASQLSCAISLILCISWIFVRLF